MKPPAAPGSSSCSVRGRYMYLRDRETRTSCTLQTATGTYCSEFVMWVLEHVDQWRETQAIYFSKSLGVRDDALQLNGLDVPHVNDVTYEYLGVTVDKRMTWRRHIERTVVKALRTYVRTYSLFKSWCLGINIKLAFFKALIRSVMTYACDLIRIRTRDLPACSIVPHPTMLYIFLEKLFIWQNIFVAQTTHKETSHKFPTKCYSH
jgi:hypothetical protein